MTTRHATARTGEFIGGNIEFFTCYTLADITDTGVYDPVQGKTYEQAQNLNALLQAISLCSQPTLSSVEKIIAADMTDHNFGSDFTTNQTVWVLRFVSERAGSITLETLIRDIDGLPLYTNLDETAIFSPEVFETQDNVTKNVYFIRNDNL